jgi:hypothetical protein
MTGFDLDSVVKIVEILGGVFVIVAAIFGGVLALRLSSQSAGALAKDAVDRAKDAKLIALDAQRQVGEVKQEIADFRALAAEKFVTAEALGRIEGRIEEVGREMRAGVDDIKNKLLEFFSRPPRSPRSGS